MEHPDWIPIYDLLPEKAAEIKKKILTLIVEKKALEIGQHLFPFPSFGHVIKAGNQWLWQPIEKKIKRSKKSFICIDNKGSITQAL